MKSLKKGFTLVELIIVITILAILAVISFISYGNYTLSAREAKRTNDLMNLAKKSQLLVVEGKAKYSDLVDGSETTVGTYKIKYGTVNFSKLQEDPKLFEAPSSGEVYQALSVNDGTKDVCIQFATRSEKDNSVIYNGNCGENIKAEVGDDRLFSGTYTTGIIAEY